MESTSAEAIHYGEAQDQFFVFHQPTRQTSTFCKAPLMILIHGGYWAQFYNLSNALCDDLVPFFQQQGYYVAQLEYRRGNPVLDGGEGGWPNTNLDLILAYNKLHDIISSEGSSYQNRIDLEKVLVIGHSAGGTLALWPSASGTAKVLEVAFKTTLKLKPTLCVAVAPIGNLLQGYVERLSDRGTAVQDYLQCIPQYDEQQQLTANSPYRLASPDQLLPMQSKTLIVAGGQDTIVPLHIVQDFYHQANLSYEQQKTEKAYFLRPEYLEIAEADHFQLVNPSTAAWQSIYEKIQEIF